MKTLLWFYLVVWLVTMFYMLDRQHKERAARLDKQLIERKMERQFPVQFRQ